MSNKIMEWIGKLAGKITSNRQITALKFAFTSVFPIVALASLAVLCSNLIESVTKGANYQKLAGLVYFFKMINEGSLLMLVIVIIFLVGYDLGRQLKCGSISSGILGVTSYVIVNIVSMEYQSSDLMSNRRELLESILNYRNLFLGVMIALISVELYRKISSSKGLLRKQTSVIPSNVQESVTSLIPVIMTVIIIAALSKLFQIVTGQSLALISLTWFQEPLSKLIQQPLGILLIVGVTQFFWFIGMHGANLTSMIRQPLFLLAFLSNMEELQLGMEPTKIVTTTFWSAFSTQSGSGITIGLIMAVLLIGKNQEQRALVKTSIISGVFNINEPLVFSYPLVLNKIYCLPFVLAPLVSTTIGYLGMASGFSRKAFIEIPWVTPPLLNAYLATGGDLKAVILQLLAIGSAVIIYLPFVVIDQRVKKREVSNDSSIN